MKSRSSVLKFASFVVISGASLGSSAGCGAEFDGTNQPPGGATDSDGVESNTSALAVTCGAGPTGSRCVEYVSESGILTVRIKTCPRPPVASGLQFLQCPGEPDFVVVGGGGNVVGTPSPGALMTGSYLVPGGDAWEADFKTHHSSGSYQAQAYSISLKVKNWSAATLKSNLKYVTVSSSYAARPYIDAQLPPNYVLVGGGGWVQGVGPGILLMEMEPWFEGVSKTWRWRVGGSYHLDYDIGYATATIVGLRSCVSPYCFSSTVDSIQSPTVSTGYATASLGINPQRVLSAIGGVSVQDGLGRFLTHLIPYETGSIGAPGAFVRTKDRSVTSRGSVWADAVSLGALSLQQ